MSSTGDLPASVVPAQLGFLAIYNPSLGTTDETLDDQIVYYTSKDSRKRHRSNPKKEDVSQDELNERLRQIGLAQGMVDFGRNFSEGRSVDMIETEKSRIILHELEVGWWILASIDLTRLPSASSTSKDASAGGKIEFSSREVKPAPLLLQDLVRAHRRFLLHHASSVSALFVRNQRHKFMGIFGRYWDTFTSTWNVLLHGNPAVSIYGGIKLAACGELGVGVGEEERGSGERAVLEGLAGNVEGLVDVIVSKFGEAERKNKVASHVPPTRPWLGSGEEPSHEDGAIFLGVGALSKNSVRDITHWMEDLYTWGSDAYGVLDNPSSTRRKKVRKQERKVETLKAESPTDERPHSPHQDKELSREVYGLKQKQTSPTKSDLASNSAGRSSNESNAGPRQAPSIRRRIKDRRPTLRHTPSSTSSLSSSNQSNKFMNYLKLGYGTHWSLTTAGSASKSQQIVENPPTPSSPAGKVKFADPGPAKQIETPDSGTLKEYFNPRIDNSAHYLIGLMGDVEQPIDHDSEIGLVDTIDAEDINSRILLRTLTVELERAGDIRLESEMSIDLGTSDTASKHTSSERTGTSTHASFESQDRNKTKKLRVVVYVNQPFIFTFVFEQTTDSLSWPSLYRALHTNLSPLQKPLLKSTSYRGPKPTITSTIPSNKVADEKSPIYDIVWDPKTLTISSSLPDIPSPLSHTTSTTADKQIWSRLDALNTHSQILATYASTRIPPNQYERTCKTARGYWISWTRIPDSSPPRLSPQNRTPINLSSPSRGSSPTFMDRNSNRSRTGQGSSFPSGSQYSGPAHPFLDYAGKDGGVVVRDKEIFLIRRASDYGGGKTSGSGSATGEGWMAGVGGMGVDTKRYIEGLLNLR